VAILRRNQFIEFFQASMFPRFTERRICIGFFVLSLLLNLIFSSVGLHNSLREVHEFRQFQTAYTTRYLQTEGFSLAYPTPLFGPPWSVPMEFPVYQMCVATVSNVTGISLEPAGRLVSLTFLYLGLPAWFLLAGAIGLPRERRWLALGLLLLSPGYLYYSRTFLIESTALCFCAWFLLGYHRVLQRWSAGWLTLAVLASTAAALTKITTLIDALVVAAAYTLWVLWRQARSPDKRNLVRTIALAWAAVLPAIFIGIAWVHFADAVKAANPLASEMVSSNLSTFNFGTWAQRLTGDFWNRIFVHTSMAVAPAINLAFVVSFGLVLGRSTRPAAILMVLGFLAGPLIFANLYYVHDYYFYASGVFLLGALCLAWNQILDLSIFSPAARWIVILLSVAVQLGSYTNGYLRTQRFNDRDPLELAQILSAVTGPDDVLLILGQDWDSRIPYAAHRRAVMVTGTRVKHMESVNSVLDRIQESRITAMVVTGSIRRAPEYFAAYAKRLHLTDKPVLASEDTFIFLAERDLTTSLARVGLMPLKEFALADNATVDAGDVIVRQRSRAQLLNPQIIDMLSPKPLMVVHPFGLDVTEENQRRVLNAHAPTDVIFDLPAHATVAVAEFGMDPGSYVKKNHTDGVEFRVELVLADGSHQILHSTYLSPTDKPSDRGERTLRVDIPPGSRGQLWFRTRPGPTGSIACAWAYWAKIEIR
jgi:hypothetical protein